MILRRTTTGLAALWILLTGCSDPTPAPPAAAPSVLLMPYPAFSLRQADSVAAAFGLMYQLYDEEGRWLDALPGSPQYTSFRPAGQLPGLRGWVAGDSASGYAPSNAPVRHYECTAYYPAFAGPRATDSLRRAVARCFDMREVVAEVRGLPLQPTPPPLEYAEDQEPDSHSESEMQVQSCLALGAYALPTDTLISALGHTYDLPSGAHGSNTLRALNFSLRRQCNLTFDELFRPALREALLRTIAAYEVVWEQQQWAQRRQRRLQPHAMGYPYPVPPLSEIFLELEQQRQQQHWRRRLLRGEKLVDYDYYTMTSFLAPSGMETDFYFGPSGVVFCLGYDLWTSRLLLPYSALPRYLRQPNDPPASPPQPKKIWPWR